MTKTNTNTADPVAEAIKASHDKLADAEQALREFDASEPDTPAPDYIVATWHAGRTEFSAADYAAAVWEHMTPTYSDNTAGRRYLVRQALQKRVTTARSALVPSAPIVADHVADALRESIRFEITTTQLRPTYAHRDGDKPHVIVSQLHIEEPVRTLNGIKADIIIGLVRGDEHAVLDGADIEKTLESDGLVISSAMPVMTGSCPGGFVDEYQADVIVPMPETEVLARYRTIDDLDDIDLRDE